MAIINTLQKCLESPYLFEDKEAPAGSASLLAKAGDRLEAAANIQTTGEGDPADIVFLSYEAMFCCLRALVYAKGYREIGLRCLLLACEHLYVKPGQLDADHLRKFELAQRLKLRPPTPFPPPPHSSSARWNCWGSKRKRGERRMVDAKLGPRPRGLGPWWNDLSHADRSAQGASWIAPKTSGQPYVPLCLAPGPCSRTFRLPLGRHPGREGDSRRR